jgi:hypothetical protein
MVGYAHPMAASPRRLERAEGVINVIADQLQPLPLVASTRLRGCC